MPTAGNMKYAGWRYTEFMATIAVNIKRERKREGWWLAAGFDSAIGSKPLSIPRQLCLPCQGRNRSPTFLPTGFRSVVLQNTRNGSRRPRSASNSRRLGLITPLGDTGMHYHIAASRYGITIANGIVPALLQHSRGRISGHESNWFDRSIAAIWPSLRVLS